MSSTEIRRTKTDEKGRFRLDDLFAEGRRGLIVRAKGYAPQRVAFKPGPAAQPAQVTVGLKPGHRIKGCVVDEAGKTIAGVDVFFTIQGAMGGAVANLQLLTWKAAFSSIPCLRRCR